MATHLKRIVKGCPVNTAGYCSSSQCRAIYEFSSNFCMKFFVFTCESGENAKCLVTPREYRISMKQKVTSSIFLST